MRNRRLGIAEVSRDGEQSGTVNDPPRIRAGSVNLKGNDAAKTALLF